MYRQKLKVDQFLLQIIDVLFSDLETDAFEVVLRLTGDQFPDTDLFILEQINDEYARVHQATRHDEIGHLWPLIGPLKRGMAGACPIIFNADLVPVLRTFTPVLSHRIVSMLTSTFTLGFTQLLFVMTSPKLGRFSHQDQGVLNHLTRLMSELCDRFVLPSAQEDRLYPKILLEEKRQCTDTPLQFTGGDIQSSSPSKLETSFYEEAGQGHSPSLKDLQQSGRKLVNRYLLLETLGQGGQAIVYKAFDDLIRRAVAIKFIRPEGKLTQEEVFKMAIREASLAANIQHASVVKIYDIGFYGPQKLPFIVMEFLEGEDLYRVLSKRTQLLPSRVLSLMIPVLEALGEAHEAGLVHRDLKPHNLYLTHVGQPTELLRVLDFGLAQFSHHEFEDHNTLQGTLSYLAPEYLSEKKISPRIDVYQAGLIIIEMITGTKVFTGKSTFQVMLDIATGAPDLSPQLAESSLGLVLRKAISLKPEDRYPDGKVFASALRALLVHESRSTAIGFNLDTLHPPPTPRAKDQSSSDNITVKLNSRVKYD